MNAFEDAWFKLLKVEGGYSDHPSDKGGKTKYGITEPTARAQGYYGAMDALPVATAKGIARREYWDSMSLDDVHRVFPRVAAELFDSGYNVGTARAARWLQRAIRSLQTKVIATDGRIGPATIAALEEYKSLRPDGEQVLLTVLNVQQGMHYLELAEANQTQRAFLYGWLRARVGV